MEYVKDEHRVHLIAYHLVWTPKRRKPVLVNSVALDCEKQIREKCEMMGWEVASLAVLPDHIHLFVRAHPTTSADEIVKQCKGVTSKTLRKAHPHLAKLPSMWTRSYFASTCGSLSEEAVRKYIDAQKGV